MADAERGVSSIIWTEEQSRASRDRMEKGLLCGRLPAGLAWGRVARRYVLDEAGAALPRRAYQRFAELRNVSHVVRQLHASPKADMARLEAVRTQPKGNQATTAQLRALAEALDKHWPHWSRESQRELLFSMMDHIVLGRGDPGRSVVAWRHEGGEECESESEGALVS